MKTKRKYMYFITAQLTFQNDNFSHVCQETPAHMYLTEN